MNYEIAFIKALLITISIETISAGGLKLFLNRRFFFNISFQKLILTVPIATLLTLPYLWFIFPAFLRGQPYIISSELFALIIEAIFYRFFLTKNTSSAFVLSFTTNAISFFIGNIIF
ncbi:MAG: hypothetical protein RBS56_04540 [Candidatus Gracilibacteria bacterium]|jgi:hypothetical protein|nr:hypothetical protein [Candidatus Gracilibacteria bacterium]